MKYARISGSTISYYARPPRTKQKAYREPVMIGQRACKNRLCAWFRKWVYELV